MPSHFRRFLCGVTVTLASLGAAAAVGVGAQPTVLRGTITKVVDGDTIKFE